MLMIDELRAMAIFAEVVKLGSFRAAAKSLNLSPSVVSYHISQLEQQVGTALLYRSTRKLSLSHEGEILIKHIEAMMHSAQQGLELINSQQAIVKGKLTVTLPTALIKSTVTERISQFAKQYPYVELNLIYSDLREDLLANGIDLAISAGRLSNSTLKAKRIGEITRTLVCQPKLYRSQKQPTLPQHLMSWQWIKLAMLPNFRIFQHPQLGEVKVEFQHQITVNNVEAMLQLALLGHGLATPATYQVTELLAQHQLIQPLPEWHIAPIPLYAVWPNNVTEKSLVKRLIAFITSDELTNSK